MPTQPKKEKKSAPRTVTSAFPEPSTVSLFANACSSRDVGSRLHIATLWCSVRLCTPFEFPISLSPMFEDAKVTKGRTVRDRERVQLKMERRRMDKVEQRWERQISSEETGKCPERRVNAVQCSLRAQRMTRKRRARGKKRQRPALRKARLLYGSSSTYKGISFKTTRHTLA